MTAKSKSPKIVYYLGAGASWHALPVISEMEERFEAFLDFFKFYHEFEASSIDFSLLDPNLLKIDLKWDTILTSLEEEPTIDTLARIAYLSENSELVFEIKQFLSAYLFWEQTISIIDSFPRVFHNLALALQIRINNPRDRDKKNRNLDFRYTSLFSSFCNARFEMNEEMSVISWNYDSQVEISLAKTFGIYEYCQKLISEGDDRSIQELNEEKFTQLFERFNFIKLNGNISTTNRTWELPLKFDVVNNEEAIIAEYDKIWNLIFKDEDYPSNIHFAWENSEIVDANREKAKTLMAEADYIVVIGYSFPQYNSEIDEEIWSHVKPHSQSHKKSITRVIIQDTPENAVRIKARLQSICNYIDIDIYTDLDQFYIP